jgi:hypothetical protein
MTTVERWILDGIGIVVTVPLGGELVGVFRAGFAARGLALTAREAAILAEARGILTSAELATLRAAHAAGRFAEVTIGGRTVVYNPGLRDYGMSLFGENGFQLGRAAFTSSRELGKTLLHELYRLSHSVSASGVSGALAAQETAAAAAFAERALALLGL